MSWRETKNENRLIYISLWTNYNSNSDDKMKLANEIYISLWTNYNTSLMKQIRRSSIIYISLWTNYNRFCDSTYDQFTDIYISLWTNYNHKLLPEDIFFEVKFTFHYELIITIYIARITGNYINLHFTMN